MEGLLPPLILELRAKAGEVHSELKKVGAEVEEMDRHIQGGSTRGQRAFHGLASAGKAITFGVAGAGIAVAAFGVEASQAAQVADAKLATAVHNVGGSMEELDPKIKGADAKLRTFGFTNAETNTALAGLTTSLKSPQKALGDLQLAADLARMKNISLSESALLVAKASEGQVRPLKALGIDLPVYAGGAQNVRLATLALTKAQEKANLILAKSPDAIKASSKAHDAYEKALLNVQGAQTKLTGVEQSGAQIMKALTDRVHGNAAAFGHTLPGQIASAKAQLDNIGEKVGSFVIPKLEQMLHVVSGVVSWFGKHTTVAKILAGVIGGVLALAMAAYITNLIKAKVQAAIQFVEMVAGWLGLGPAAETAAAVTATAGAEIAATSEATGAATSAAFGPIGLAVAALGVAIMLLATHWKQVWGAIKAAVSAAWNDVIKPVFGFIKQHWGLVFAAVTGGLSLIVQHWRQVWGAVKSVYDDTVRPVFDFIKDHWRLVVDVVTGGLGVLVTHWRQVWGAIRAVYDNTIAPVFHLIGSVATGAWHTITAIGSRIASAWSSVWNGLKSTVVNVVRDIGSVVSGIFSGVKTGIADVINGGITIINSAIKFINSNLIDTANDVPFVNIPHIPQIPLVHFAHGGSVGNGWFVSGENGPELGFKSGPSVRMFSNARSSAMLAGGGSLSAGGASSGGSGSGGGGGEVIELHSHLMLDGREIYDSVERHALRTGMRRGESYQNYSR